MPAPLIIFLSGVLFGVFVGFFASRRDHLNLIQSKNQELYDVGRELSACESSIKRLNEEIERLNNELKPKTPNRMDLIHKTFN